MARASSGGVQRRTEEKGDLLSAQEVPPWHGEAVPAWPRRHQARRRRRRYVGKPPHPPAPDLAEGKANRLETKLEVTMAETQGAGGGGAEGIEGVIVTPQNRHLVDDSASATIYTISLWKRTTKRLMHVATCT
jgi:hypothetical protein